MRTLYQSEVVQTEAGFDYVVTGSGFLTWFVFLWHFNRGGKGKRNPDEVPQLLEEKIETMYLSLHLRRTLFRKGLPITRIT